MNQLHYNYYKKMNEFKKRLQEKTRELNELTNILKKDKDKYIDNEQKLKNQIRELTIQCQRINTDLKNKQEIMDENFDELINKEIEMKCLKEHIEEIETKNKKQKQQLFLSDQRLLQNSITMRRSKIRKFFIRR